MTKPIVSSGLKATIRELWRQFWPPLLIALTWTAFKGWEASPITSYPIFLGILVSQFSTAFFLLSWAWGQFNRVDRQQDTTARLKTIQKSLVESEKATAGILDLQKQQAAIFQKLETLAPSDPTFRPIFWEANRLAVESSALSVQANTATLSAVNATLSPDGTFFRGPMPHGPVPRELNPIYRPGPLPEQRPTSSPLPSAAKDGPKSER